MPVVIVTDSATRTQAPTAAPYTVNVALPTGAQVGELILVVIYHQSDVGASSTTATGWSVAADMLNATRRLAVAVYPITNATALANLGTRVTFTTASSPSSSRGAAVAWRVQGVGLSTPVLSPNLSNASVTTTSTPWPALAAVTGAGLLFRVAETNNSAATPAVYPVPTWPDPNYQTYADSVTVSTATTQGLMAWRPATDAATAAETTTYSPASTATVPGYWFFLARTSATVYPVSGSAAGTSTTSGTATARRQAAATAGIVSATSGTATARRQAAATAGIVSGSAGAVTVRRQAIAVTGTAGVLSGSAGAVTIRHPVTGITAATSASTGQVSTRHPVAGTLTVVVSGTQGQVTVASPAAGTAALTTGAAGDVTVLHATAATTPIRAASTGQVVALYQATGTTAARTDTAGSVASLAQVSGTTAAVSDSSLAPAPAAGGVAKAPGLVLVLPGTGLVVTTPDTALAVTVPNPLLEVNP